MVEPDPDMRIEPDGPSNSINSSLRSVASRRPILGILSPTTGSKSFAATDATPSQLPNRARGITDSPDGRPASSNQRYASAVLTVASGTSNQTALAGSPGSAASRSPRPQARAS